jgi:plasmid stabilization system protein ParE
MTRYRLSRLARTDLDRIWFRIASKASIQTADRLIDAITDRFPMLANMPEAGRASEHIEPGLRVFPVRNYLIYYRRAPRARILIARVIHGMREQHKAWKEKA